MNRELILKIRREAITKWVSNHNIAVHKFSDEPEPDNIESLEIFAELIIKECADIAWNNEPDGEISNLIKAHFGVR